MSEQAVTAADFEKYKWDINHQRVYVQKVADDLDVSELALLDALATCGVKLVPAGHVNIAAVAYMKLISEVTR